MRVYQIYLDHRKQRHRIRSLTVTGEETDTAYIRRGPVALASVSKKTAFKSYTEARACLERLTLPATRGGHQGRPPGDRRAG